MAKAKTKAAVKRKTAKTQPQAPVARAVKTPKKAAPAKAAKSSAAKPAKPGAVKAAATVVLARTSAKPPIIAAPRKTGTEPLTLPVTKPTEAPAAKPLPVARKSSDASPRADLPPEDGFTLLVDGHFKSRFDDIKRAKAAASELKGRFPMLRVEIYDAATKTRLPA